MATHPTKLFLGIYEPAITIFLDAGEELEEMVVVKLGTGADAGSVFAEDGGTLGTYPYGWCTQNVTTAGVTQYGLNGLITRTAKVGDKIGIYAGGGILKTDKLVDPIVAGDVLYPGTSGSTDGYVTATPSTQAIPVGIAETDPDADGIIRFKSLI
jgi:hypothetical protein